eukprot:1649085-Pyramimonas_sp.AAC.1
MAPPPSERASSSSLPPLACRRLQQRPSRSGAARSAAGPRCSQGFQGGPRGLQRAPLARPGGQTGGLSVERRAGGTLGSGAPWARGTL